DHGFLLTEQFENLYREVTEAFAASDTRPAHLAGSSYPDDPGALRTYLNGLFDGMDAPPVAPAERRPVRCLIAPHIDLDRGGAAYAHAYHRLAQGPAPRTVLIFGVAHAGPPAPFVMTRKHFATPLGVVTTNLDAVERLAAACTWDPFEDEIVHRTEHSIEFQALMLAHLFGGQTRIVPILCSGPEEPDASSPSDAVAPFLRVCRDMAAESDGALAVIAGADLAHVGLRFGDEFDIDDEVIARIRARDTEDLGHVVTPDPAAWYRSVMSDGNQRRVCGLHSIYAALESVEGLVERGDLLHYAYAADPAGGIVSFAAAALS
ncbi:MAG: AmmeMemoRadiSam system protein B, partial [Candidatus Hydrogenedentes bacterium]|nr:AmmeMemoRadiSam system protein B [Candidatus Hydrogenedentota bacterium]